MKNKDLKNLNTSIELIEHSVVGIFKNLILDSNQFSTQFVIQKIMQDFLDHSKKVKSVGNELEHSQKDDINLSFFKPGNLLTAFPGDSDYSLLNFVEASVFSITILKNQIEIYQNLEKQIADTQRKEILLKIIQLKRDYLDKLESEYERLRYKE